MPGLKTTTYGTGDYSWLLNTDGLDEAVSGVIDVSTFTAGTHYPDGYFPSGLPVHIDDRDVIRPWTDTATVNEVQTVTITGTPTGGTFTLTFSGQTTAAISFDATAATVQAALVALSNVSAGDVTVTGGPGPGTAYTVTFGGAYFNQDVPAMTATGSFTGGITPAVAVTTATAGVPGARLGFLKGDWKTDGVADVNCAVVTRGNIKTAKVVAILPTFVVPSLAAQPQFAFWS